MYNNYKNKKWSLGEENTILLMISNGKSRNEIAKFLNRSENAILYRLYKIATQNPNQNPEHIKKITGLSDSEYQHALFYTEEMNPKKTPAKKNPTTHFKQPQNISDSIINNKLDTNQYNSNINNSNINSNTNNSNIN